MKANKLQPGEKAIITQIADGYLTNKLLEMGCIPGTPLMVEFKAAGGDPIAFNVDGYLLGLRYTEAEYIDVKLLADG